MSYLNVLQIKHLKNKLHQFIVHPAANLQQHLPVIWAFNILNFLFFHFVIFLTIENISANMCPHWLSTLLVINSLIFLGWHKIVFIPYKIKIFFIYFSFIFSFAFYSSYMLIINNSANEWQLNYLIISIALIGLFKEIIALIILITGYLLAYYHLNSFINFEMSKNAYPLIFYITFLASIIKYLKIYFKTFSYKQNNLSLASNSKLFEEKLALQTAYILHEISNPLHGVTGIIKILSKNSKLNKIEYIKQIKNVDSALSNLTYFINELSEYSKLRSRKEDNLYEVIDLINIIKKIIFEQKTYTNRSIKFYYKNITQATILANKLKIHQLLSNIFINAIKYGGEGNITITITKTIKDKRKYWYLEITDEGEGILPTELEYIFEPFARSSKLSNCKNGSGLGLALSKEIVSELKGFIWAENRNDSSGAKFMILIPVVEY